VSPTEAVELQRRLAHEVVTTWSFEPSDVRTVAGVDLSPPDPTRTANPDPSPTPNMATVTPSPTTLIVAATATAVETPIGDDAPPPLDPTPDAPEDPVLVVGGQPFRIELAVAREEFLRGLSGRTFLDPDAGLLFAFSSERTLSF
jgi:hypothetical protein